MIEGCIGKCPYQILEVMNLPQNIQDHLLDDCPGNGTGRIINPEYKPLLKQWLKDNGYNDEECFLAWWSW
jgi:hypothetical protein